MKQHVLKPIIALLVLASSMPVWATGEQATESVTIQNATGNKKSGVEPQFFDEKVGPKQDFYQYVNGTWIKYTTVPEAKGVTGRLHQLDEVTTKQLKGIINDLSRKQLAANSDEQKILDLYTSYMDEAGIKKHGIESLREDLAVIDSLKNHQDLARVMAHLSGIGVDTPIGSAIEQDIKNSKAMMVMFEEGGLSLEQAEDYLGQGFNQKVMLDNLRLTIRDTLQFAGLAQDAKLAAQVVKLQTQLAKHHENIDSDDVLKGYNIYTVEQLHELMPKFDWNVYLEHLELKGRVDKVQISQPKYFKALNDVITKTPIDVWKAYLKYQLLNGYATVLNTEFTNHTSQNAELIDELREEASMEFINGLMGEAIGKLYVQKYFPPEKKQQVSTIVENIKQAYATHIDQLDWMSPSTKQEAHRKLATLRVKIGHGDKWRDYSSLTIRSDDAIGNIKRAYRLLAQAALDKLNKPVDFDAWDTTPQEVNGYYSANLNEIVIPAAMLQQSNFNIQTDEAVIYGGLGSFIGHEIGHAFDDLGSKFDADGNYRSWWTDEDWQRYLVKKEALTKQYSQYEVLPKRRVDGKLTLGENIADNLGLYMSYQAYMQTIKRKEAQVLDGFTPAQRFYMGLAQFWRSKSSEETLLEMLEQGPHTPDHVRVNAALKNQPGFYEAFDVKKGDKMYLEPSKRVQFW